MVMTGRGEEEVQRKCGRYDPGTQALARDSHADTPRLLKQGNCLL